MHYVSALMGDNTAGNRMAIIAGNTKKKKPRWARDRFDVPVIAKHNRQLSALRSPSIRIRAWPVQVRYLPRRSCRLTDDRRNGSCPIACCELPYVRQLQASTPVRPMRAVQCSNLGLA